MPFLHFIIIEGEGGAKGAPPFFADDCMGEECCPFAGLRLSETHGLFGWKRSGV